MAWERFRQNRRELAQKIQDRWIELNVEDIVYIDVYRDRLIERLMMRYDMTCEQATKQVSKWQNNLVLPDNCAKLQSSAESSTMAD